MGRRAAPRRGRHAAAAHLRGREHRLERLLRLLERDLVGSGMAAGEQLRLQPGAARLAVAAFLGQPLSDPLRRRPGVALRLQALLQVENEHARDPACLVARQE
ncbi:hypothetical protein AD428_12650 [Achromobacter sp. DMS1]|nr:hypothetical protein AD428_12650 [Achromobacter sp. DMS1]